MTPVPVSVYINDEKITITIFASSEKEFSEKVKKAVETLGAEKWWRQNTAPILH